jgi:hypothetical protein
MIRFSLFLLLLWVLFPWTTTTAENVAAEKHFHQQMQKFFQKFVQEFGGEKVIFENHFSAFRLSSVKVAKLLREIEENLVDRIQTEKEGNNRKCSVKMELLGSWLAENQFLSHKNGEPKQKAKLLLSFAIQLAFSVGRRALDEATAGQEEEKVDLDHLLFAHDCLQLGKGMKEIAGEEMEKGENPHHLILSFPERKDKSEDAAEIEKDG